MCEKILLEVGLFTQKIWNLQPLAETTIMNLEIKWKE